MLVWKRAILVVGVLLCLCASDSVGPRLLPLPAQDPAQVKNVSSADEHSVSRLPASKKSGAYSKIVAPSGTRSRAQHTQVDTATHAPAVSTVASATPIANAPYELTAIGLTSGSLSNPAGRAPPRL